MPQAADQPSPPLRTWRPMAAWTAGILLALGLAWFVGAVVVPVWKVRIVLADNCRWAGAEKVIRVEGAHTKSMTRTWRFLYWRGRDGLWSFEAACKDLGGKERAASRLRAYLAMPNKLAPKCEEAVCILSVCGQSGVRPLIGQLSATSADTRCAAAWALGEIGPEATEAAGFLEGLLNDSDEDVRLAASDALKKIRGEEAGK